MIYAGVMYPGAQSSVTCDTPDYWDTSKPSYKLLYVKFIWVPIVSQTCIIGHPTRCEALVLPLIHY
jgi:hypothetical protein